MKSLGLTEESLGELLFLRQVGVHGTLGGAVECVDIKRNAGGESGALGLTEPTNVIKRVGGLFPDAEVRKPGERTGLDTPVVHAVNDAY